VKQADGFEAFRQLTLTLRPSSNNRGLALMGALTNWPAFTMGQLLQPQVLKLEEALEEARKAGSTLPDQLQQAILLKCVSEPGNSGDDCVQGAQRAGLEVGPQSAEMEQFIFSDDASGGVPMEVDRVYTDVRGWNSGKKVIREKERMEVQKGPQKEK
jgi:hypothetical protein